MNNILQLKGRFSQRANTSRPGAPRLPKNAIVKLDKLIILKKNLIEMKDIWARNTYFEGALVSAYYIKVAAKSNRVARLLAAGSTHPNTTIVGAKFNREKDKHIITHYISIQAIKNSISVLEKSIEILKTEFDAQINDDVFNKPSTFTSIRFENYNIPKTTFQNVIVDSYYVEKFDVEHTDMIVKENSIITVYETDVDTQELLGRIGINILNSRVLNKTTILLDSTDLDILKQKAPYLIAMATEDLNELSPTDFETKTILNEIHIPSPENEPTIGVIDTLFDEGVYFSEWVNYEKRLDKHITVDSKDYLHGTAVTSIIVDGPSLNPWLNDGCGRFKVRHFGVSTGENFSSFTIIREIKEIVISNRDIRVWNFSLGSNEEVNDNFISAEGAVLDQIQFEYDVIFIIAGTNKKSSEEEKKIGAPADAINAMVVNSVNKKKIPTAYSRRGTVLSFFNKPDVAYYGGAEDDYIIVSGPLGNRNVQGTSFAAPWIARKMSYLIDILGLSKEVAKALLIDSAIGWEMDNDFAKLALQGYGVVPIKIDDIVKSAKDEIRFVVTGVSEKYDTYTFNIPVPVDNEKHPYIAKATLCYFPKCSRSQGVDYTNTELDIYFGRIKNNGKIDSVNKNRQSLENEANYLKEEDARKLFRKWDNVKHISEEIISRPRPRKAYENQMWGMSIKTKERLNNRDGEGIHFGVVVTLKEMNGVNRIDEFIQQCNFRGWLVNEINVESRIDIYETLHEEIELE